jgi:hypothetical protein
LGQGLLKVHLAGHCEGIAFLAPGLLPVCLTLISQATAQEVVRLQDKVREGQQLAAEQIDKMVSQAIQTQEMGWDGLWVLAEVGEN